ncbi:MAG: hypothetical protein BMS9Abin12_0908 [Acidimicrobiia bacterium]|nr:MAG: hypothetical protein BMS9Abin12_0908 [Acidimicrobiia bacterium]
MRVYRSPLKLFVFGIVGVVLIAAAADITFGNWVSTPPDNTDGVLTTRGQAQQRGDLLWGGAMVAAGTLLFGASVTELVRRKPAVVIDAEGFIVDTGVRGGAVIPWGSVDAISSRVISDPYDGSIREQLVIETRHDPPVPIDLSAFARDGNTVYVDAHDWANRVTEVALAAQGTHDYFQRTEAVRLYEPPSIVWETTILQPDKGSDTESDVSEPIPEEDPE